LDEEGRRQKGRKKRRERRVKKTLLYSETGFCEE